MTYATDTISTSTKAPGLFAALRAPFARIASRRRYNETLRELSALSDRDLADIGLTRGDVRNVAREVMHLAR